MVGESVTPFKLWCIPVPSNHRCGAAYCHGKFFGFRACGGAGGGGPFFPFGGEESGDVVDLILGDPPVDFPWDKLVDLPIIWLTKIYGKCE